MSSSSSSPLEALGLKKSAACAELPMEANFLRGATRFVRVAPRREEEEEEEEHGQLFRVRLQRERMMATDLNSNVMTLRGGNPAATTASSTVSSASASASSCSTAEDGSAVADGDDDDDDEEAKLKRLRARLERVARDLLRSAESEVVVATSFVVGEGGGSDDGREEERSVCFV